MSTCEPSRHGPNGVVPWNGRLHTTKQTWHHSFQNLFFVFNSSFWDFLPKHLIDSIQVRKRPFLCFRALPHSNGTKMPKIIVFPTIAHIFVHELQSRSEKDFRHSNDFVIKKNLEMFIVYHNFTGKIDSWNISLRTWTIHFFELETSLPVLRSAQWKACVKAFQTCKLTSVKPIS